MKERYYYKIFYYFFIFSFYIIICSWSLIPNITSFRTIDNYQLDKVCNNFILLYLDKILQYNLCMMIILLNFNIHLINIYSNYLNLVHLNMSLLSIYYTMIDQVNLNNISLGKDGNQQILINLNLIKIYIYLIHFRYIRIYLVNIVNEYQMIYSGLAKGLNSLPERQKIFFTVDNF